ncbi:MAG TPA: dihydropteroate synthase [Miltoncostaeaceae bacterium]|nr:dihydropteroate synthase [Miltoncostaeaceae bacterium]
MTPTPDPLADLPPDAVRWVHARGEIDCRRGHLVGIVNATPDSFTDEGRYYGTDASVAHGVRLAEAGASVVEVGGESLRFSAPTDPAEEAARVVPVITRLAAELDVPVAIDTFKAPVAEEAIAAGAGILNDPTGLRDPAMARVAAVGGVGVVLTHFFGEPKVRPPSFPDVDVPQAVVDWGGAALAEAAAAGIPAERIVVDPGVGLGKSPPQDLTLLHRLGEVAALGRPVFVPISHKKVLGAVTGLAARERTAPTAAGVVWCRLQGASLFRVHDVTFMRHVLTAAEAMLAGAPGRWHEVVK